MKSDPLDKLIERARSASPSDNDGEVAAPMGFATRVVALAREQAEAASWATVFERKAWRALGLAGGIAVMSVAFNLPAVSDSIDQKVLEADDPITALWDLS